MKTYVDHLLKIGKTHKVCEDYIISGYEPVPYIILSDGCSSSNNTDIGARILCLEAKQYLTYHKNSIKSIDEVRMGEYIIWKSDSIAMQLGLDQAPLDATLMVAYYYNHLLKIIVYGDGCIVFIDNVTGETEIINIEYDKNIPYYLSYTLEKERDKIYKSNKIKKLIDRDYIKSDRVHLLTSTDSREEYAITYGIYPGEDKTILILSDGISTFFNKEQQEFLPIKDLIQDFSSFKTLKGEFLHRRLLSKKGAITKLEQQGYNHLDDLSVGAFVIKGE